MYILFAIVIFIYFMYHLNNKKEQFENSENTYGKVYISFTTIPSRIAYIDEMLRSVDIPEVYEIHLNLQSEYEYPEKEIERLKSITPKLKVFWSTGKYIIMSKSIPTLERLLGTNALVLVVDDDFVYSRKYINMFINSYDENEKKIIGKNMFEIIKFSCKITHSLQGGYGILYPMKIITKEIVNDMIKSGKLSISCYKLEDMATIEIFHKHGIGIKQVKEKLPEIKELEYSKVDAVRSFSHPPEFENGYKYDQYECCLALNN